MKRGSVTELWRRRPPHSVALVGLFLWLPWTFLTVKDTGVWWLWILGAFAWLICIWDLAWAIRTPRLMPMEKVTLINSSGREVTFRIIQISHEPDGGATVYMETDSTYTARHTY